MSKNKAHKEIIKELKRKQEEEFLATIPFPESIFQELFCYLDSKLKSLPCQHNFNLTTKFLASKGIDLQKNISFFIQHGGGCDCEVLMNVEEVFPEEEIQQTLKAKNAAKREKINSLNFQDLQIDSVPAPWSLFKIADHYEFQFGKNKDIKIELIKDFKVTNWNDDNYWQRQWEQITELEVKAGRELNYEEVEGFERVTFKTQEWIPVLTWVRKRGNESWGLLFRTELSRLRGDLNEFKNLLKKIK